MKLSVITPTHNRMGLLEQALEALDVQTYRPDGSAGFELVVTVDGSTDGTLVMLEAFKRRASFPITVLSLPQGGQARARNQAIRAATGEVLVFMDDDLILGPDTLSRHAAFHEVHPNDIAVGAVKNASDGRLDLPRVVTWMNFTGMNVSVSRKAVLDVGLFDESFAGYGGEDLDLGIRLERAGHRFRVLKDAVSTHLAPAARDAHKGLAAGRAARILTERYGPEVGLMLGVHPVVLGLKRVVMNPVMDVILGRNPSYVFERAYMKGAREQRPESVTEINTGPEQPESKKAKTLKLPPRTKDSK